MTFSLIQKVARLGRSSREKDLSKRRRFLSRLNRVEQLEARAMMARDFLESPNDVFPGQTVEHFNPSATGIVDSRSSGATITDGDVDFYTFRSAVAGEVVVTLANNGGDPQGDTSSADVALQLQQVDSLGANIGSPTNVALSGTSGRVTIAGVSAGTQYWFKVLGATPTSDANYQLTLQNRDREDDAGGNNNTQAVATPLGTFGSITPASLSSYTITSPDIDYFSFTSAASTASMTVSVVMPTGSGAASGSSGPTNLGVRIRNAAGTIISSSNGTTTAVDSATFTAAASTQYFIEVYSGSLGQVNQYDLAIVQNPAATGSISGFKFTDLNADGLWDENEPGVNGISVTLDVNNDGNVTPDVTVVTANHPVTGQAGYYAFSNVAQGTHAITEAVPAGTVQTRPGAASSFSYVVSVNNDNLTLDHLDFGNALLDFGDAPDPSYPTLLVNNGARHIVNTSGLFLGATIDGEVNGQQSANANGDDTNGSDDEDGIAFSNTWVQGQSANLVVTSTGVGLINAWADFNNDGDWADLGEQIFTNSAVVAGSNNLSFTVPVGATVGATNVRFRLNSAGGLSPTGLANDGEVEDYQVGVFAPATIQFVLANSSVAEPSTPTTSHTVNVVLNMTAGTLANTTTVDIVNLLTGTATVTSDYLYTTPTTVTFNAGAVNGATQSVSLTINDDLLAELDETINLQLQNLNPGSGQVSLGATQNHQVTITDVTDRNAVTVRFNPQPAPSTSSVAESNTTHNVTVELVTTGGITLGSALNVQVVNAGTGTATQGAGNDFTFTSPQTVTFNSGAANGATTTVAIGILDDTLAENDETIDLAFGTVTGPVTTPLTALPLTHTVTITDATDRGAVSLRFAAANSSVAEATVGHNVNVELVTTGSITLAIVLTANVTDAGGGTATSATDYNAIGTQTVTFPIGSGNGATQPATVTVINDTVAEADETVNLGLGTIGPFGTLAAPSTHVVTITDAADRGNVSVQFQTATSNVAEATTNHNVAVLLAMAGGVTSIGADLTVSVGDAGGGSATSATDYSAVGVQTITFPSGSIPNAMQNAVVGVLDDTLAEANETVNLGLTYVSGPGTLGAPAAHQVTITDNSDRSLVSVQFQSATSNAPEQTSPHNVNAVLVLAGGITALGGAVSVNVTDAVTGTATSGTDYGAIGTIALNFPANSVNNATATAQIAITNDTLFESPDETINLALAVASGPATGVSAQPTHTVTIVDNDQPTVSVTASISAASESGPVNGQFTFTLSTMSATSTTVNVNVSGTATAGPDYSSLMVPVIIPANTLSVTLPVLVVNDTVVEPSETVIVTISSVSAGVSIAASPNDTATVNIADDDATSVQITANDPTANETATDNGQFTVSLVGGKTAPTGGIAVNFTVSGTATPTTDYAAIGTTSVTIPAGANSVTIDVNGIVDDATVEGPETVVVTLTSTNNANVAIIVAPNDSATVTILDNDNAAITGKKFNDLNGNGNDNSGTDPGLGGWTIELFSDVNNNGVFEPTVSIGDFVIAGADGLPTATAVTSANGSYNLGLSSMATGRYFVREAQQQGWRQTTPANFHTVMYATNTPVSGLNFGNLNCTDTMNVPDGNVAYTAARAGIVTVELLGGGTFTVTKTSPNTQFQAYNGDYDSGSGALLPLGTSVTAFSSNTLSSPSGTNKRVDILVAAGDAFSIAVSGTSGNSKLRILNAVNVATASTLALQVTGSDCGETIVVQDDTSNPETSDAKRIFIGGLNVTTATLNNGADVDPATANGVQYNAKIINAIFGTPAISRVEITANGGDDYIRVGSTNTAKDVTKQSTISAGNGNDIVRAGSGKSTINGGAGQDFLLGGIADDVIYGGDGNDYIYGAAGNDQVGGDNNDDVVGGGPGDDPIVRGGAGNDQISGGTGKDGLYGDAGTDTGFRETTDLIVQLIETSTLVTPGDNNAVDNNLKRINNNLWDETIDNYLSDADRDTLDEILNSLLT